MRRTAVASVLWVAALCAAGCSEGAGSDEGGLTSGGVGGAFATGGIGGAGGGGASGIGGASGLGGAGGIGGAGGVVGGMGGASGMAGGMGGASGMMAGMGGGGAGGTGGMMAGAGGMAGGGAGGTAGMTGDGDCCPDGNCICHGDDPTALTNQNGPFDYESYRVANGTIFYPTDAEPPFSAIAICPGFLNSGPEMEPWGPFYASHGFVLIATDTIGSDFPDVRATKLLAAIDTLKMENDSSSSPIAGMLAGRFGTSGYSMGGGGTTIAASTDSTLMTSIGLAAWGPVGAGVTVPTLFLCGLSDGTAPCSQSQGAYGQMPGETPKMIVGIPAATHFSWFGPQDAGMGRSGAYALAFQKVFLDGDERWREFLVEAPSSGDFDTNIEP